MYSCDCPSIHLLLFYCKLICFLIYLFFFQLNAEQRTEMCDHRLRAVQLEVDKQNKQRNLLLAQVQNILNQTQVSRT